MNSQRKKQHLNVLEKNEQRKADATYAIELEKDISFDVKMLEALAAEGCRPIHYDLLVLCGAIEFADRHWERPGDWHRYLKVTVPVLDLETWQQPVVQRSLVEVLNYLTGDSWSFNFIKSKNQKPCDWHQLTLEVGEAKSFVIAYSEGLDSRAVSALYGTQSEALCILVAKVHHAPMHGDSSYIEIPFSVNNKNGDESTFRSRGFQFACMASIAADIKKIEEIIVPESGQGALGPAMLPLYGLHADYRNYPSFFRKMEPFIASLLGHKVSFKQPRLWYTKGQTLQEFLKISGKTSADLMNTRSCWQTRHVVNVDFQRQCGLCAACLLRRFSLYTAGIEEAPDNYVISNLRTSNLEEAMALMIDSNDRDNMLEYGTVGARHFQHLADMVRWDEFELEVYALEIAEALNLPVSETLTKMKTLLAAHAQEWHTFLRAHGSKSFLHTWLGGGI